MWKHTNGNKLSVFSNIFHAKKCLLVRARFLTEVPPNTSEGIVMNLNLYFSLSTPKTLRDTEITLMVTIFDFNTLSGKK